MIKMSRFLIVISFLSVAYVRAAQNELQTNSNGQDSITKYLYADSKAIWPEGHRRINVCWENANSAPEAAITDVQNAVAQTWQKYSAVVFVWSRQCPQRSEGVRIGVEDTADLGPHTSCAPNQPDHCLGYFLNGLQNGVVFNFTYQKWSQSCQQMISYCNKAIAVHEFGHVLGFAHEQNRPDAPGECQLQRQGTNGDLLLTPYDPFSVMNYCNQKWNNDGQLSEKDRQAVQKYYSKP